MKNHLKSELFMKVVTLVKASLCNVDFFKFVQIHWEERGTRGKHEG